MKTTAGQRLKLMLEESGMSQSKLAKLLKLSPSTVGNWVQEVNQIGDNEKMEILKHFPQINEAWFFDESGPMKTMMVMEPQGGYGKKCDDCVEKEKRIRELWKIIEEKSKTIEQQDKLLSMRGEGGKMKSA